MASRHPFHAVLLLSLLLLPAAALSAVEDAPQDPAADEIALLIASGSAAEQRFNADKAANGSAIIDAALAFTRAQRLLGRTAADPRRVDVQTHLYWCRKQMDVETLSVFARRLGELDRSGTLPPTQLAAGTAKPARKAAQTIAVKAPPEPAATGAAPAIETPTARDQLVARTRERALALAAAGVPPRFTLGSTRQEAILIGGNPRAADLRLGDSGMDLPWKLLADADWCAIAVDLSRSGERPDHALAACWLAREHRAAEAESQLIAAGPAAAAIAELFPGGSPLAGL